MECLHFYAHWRHCFSFMSLSKAQNSWGMQWCASIIIQRVWSKEYGTVMVDRPPIGIANGLLCLPPPHLVCYLKIHSYWPLNSNGSQSRQENYLEVVNLSLGFENALLSCCQLPLRWVEHKGITLPMSCIKSVHTLEQTVMRCCLDVHSIQHHPKSQSGW